MRMVVTAPKATVYGKAMVAGEEFDCPDKEAKVWEALARAKTCADGGAIEKNDQIGLLSEKSNDAAEAHGRRRRSGSYNRRDMRAED
jgi:hypothetical protein